MDVKHAKRGRPRRRREPPSATKSATSSGMIIPLEQTSGRPRPRPSAGPVLVNEGVADMNLLQPFQPHPTQLEPLLNSAPASLCDQSLRYYATSTLGRDRIAATEAAGPRVVGSQADSPPSWCDPRAMDHACLDDYCDPLPLAKDRWTVPAASFYPCTVPSIPTSQLRIFGSHWYGWLASE